MTADGSVFNLTCWVDVLRRTFLMSVSLLTLMSMLTGVLGNASKTSRSRGMRVSSPPSQKHSAQKSTRCKQLRSGRNAASGVERWHVNYSTIHWPGGFACEYLSGRSRPACRGMKGVAAKNTKQRVIYIEWGWSPARTWKWDTCEP